MTKEESQLLRIKNDRLVAFAGFKPHSFLYYTIIAPDGTETSRPDLYNSLDAQAKYLWPKIGEAWWSLTYHPIKHEFLELWNDKGYTDAIPAHAIAEVVLAYLDEKEKVK